VFQRDRRNTGAFATGLEGLLPTVLNPHQPRFMALSLSSDESLHFLCFGDIEQAVRWKNLFTDATPAMAAGVNNRVAGGTTPLVEVNPDP